MGKAGGGRARNSEEEPDNHMNLLSGEHQSPADHRRPRLTDHHLKKSQLVDRIQQPAQFQEQRSQRRGVDSATAIALALSFFEWAFPTTLLAA